MSGGRAANLSIATDESYIDKTGERVDRTEWHRIVTFQPGLVDMLVRTRERPAGLRRGQDADPALAQGRRGSDRFSTEILLVPGSRIQFLDRANGAAAETPVNGSAMPAGGAPAQADGMADEIPF